MSAMKACFQIAECSLSYAKVQNNPCYMIGYDEILGIIISVLAKRKVTTPSSPAPLTRTWRARFSMSISASSKYHIMKKWAGSLIDGWALTAFLYIYSSNPNQLSNSLF